MTDSTNATGSIPSAALPIAASKPVAKKPVAKKPVAKKAASKKPVAKKAASKKPVAKKADKVQVQGDKVKSRMVRVDAKFAAYLEREAARFTREKKEHHAVTDVTRLLVLRLDK